jgi:hypothetical protein
MQKPAKVDDQRSTWSSYKNSNTLKTMIGTSPRGIVTYVSPSYAECKGEYTHNDERQEPVGA